jgi:hypothetical protein
LNSIYIKRSKFLQPFETTYSGTPHFERCVSKVDDIEIGVIVKGPGLWHVWTAREVEEKSVMPEGLATTVSADMERNGVGV